MSLDALENMKFNKWRVLEKVEAQYSIPSRLYLECTNLCNARCVFCYYKEIHDDLIKKVMPQDLFEDIVNQYIEMGGTEVALTPTIADPLTDSMFVERVEFLDKSAIKNVSFYTNLINFKANIRNALTKVRNTKFDIHVSFTGFNKEKYHEFMGVDKFETVKANLLKLSKLRDANHNNIKTRVVMRSYEGCEQAAAELQNYLQELNILSVVDNVFDTWGGLLENELTNNKFLKLKKRQPRIGPCKVSYTKPVITVSGDFKICDCRDVFGDLVVDNVLDTPLFEIWNSKKLKEVRNKFFDPETLPQVCKKCEVYQSIYK